MKKIIVSHKIISLVVIFIVLVISSVHFINWPNTISVSITSLSSTLLKLIRLLLVPFVSISFIIKLVNYKNQNALTSSIFAYEAFIFAISILFSIFSYIGNTTLELVLLPLLFYIAWPLTEKEIIIEVLTTQSIIFIISILLTIIGFSTDIIYFEHGLRHAIGFSHPNSAGLCAFTIVVCLCLLFYLSNPSHYKFIFLFNVLCLISSIIIFVLTKSRTSFIASVFILLLTMFCYVKKDFALRLTTRRSIKYALCVFPFICVVLSLLLGLVLGNDAFRSSNFSYRFYEGLAATNKYGLSLFGVDITGYVLDNNYYCILLRSGILPFTFYILLCICSFYKAIQAKDINFIVFLICLHLYQAMESFIPLFPLLFLEFSYIVCIKATKYHAQKS